MYQSDNIAHALLNIVDGWYSGRKQALANPYFLTGQCQECLYRKCKCMAVASQSRQCVFLHQCHRVNSMSVIWMFMTLC